MSSLGVVQFYYTKVLPERAVAIAQIKARPYTPGDLTNIVNWPYLSGSLAVTGFGSGTIYDAQTLGTTVAISGYTQYLIENQFFELTNLDDGAGNPWFYQHPLGSSAVTEVEITDLAGNAVTTGFAIIAGVIYHSFAGGSYYVSTHDGLRVNSKLLQYTPVLKRAVDADTASYIFSGNGYLGVASTSRYYLRFVQANGFEVLPPYSVPPNDPWYVRLRFHLRPIATEWGRQLFYPQSPYKLATWVPGKVLSSRVVEFERQQVYFNPSIGQYPDILVYDKDYNLKYALDGVPASYRQAQSKGFLFPWQRHQILDMDAAHARVLLNIDLAPDDQVFGFYAYNEPDIVFTDLDINPYSNPAVRNSVIQFFWKSQPSVDLNRNLYYEILNAAGAVTGTSDPSYSTGSKVYFGALAVGFSVGVEQFELMDNRTRGGGLAAQYQSIEASRSMWDLGYWDGKPYPLGGALIVLLPQSLLSSFSHADIVARVAATIPMGVLPIIRYLDAAGQEIDGVTPPVQQLWGQTSPW